MKIYERTRASCAYVVARIIRRYRVIVTKTHLVWSKGNEEDAGHAREGWRKRTIRSDEERGARKSSLGGGIS